MTAALADLRVLVLGVQPPARLLGRWLGDLGADVVRGPGGPGYARLSTTVVDEDLRSLADRADLIVGDDASVAAWRHARPALITVALPAFPEGSAHAHLDGDDAVVGAALGLHEPLPALQPRFANLGVPSLLAAAYALNGALAAVIAARRDGRGQHVAVSREDAMIGAFELNAMFTVSPPKRWSTLLWAATPFIGSYGTADGGHLYLHAGLAKHAAALIGALEAAFAGSEARLRRALSARTLADPTQPASLREARRITAIFQELFARRDAAWWEEHLARHGLCAVAVNDPPTWASHPHARAAGQVVAFDGLIAPGSPAEVVGATPGPRPPRGDTVDAVRSRWYARKPASERTSGAPPLAGLRVLDLTQVIAGPAAGRMLAELGADVRRVENPAFQAPWVEPFHVAFNAGKRTEWGDLASPGGREAFFRHFDAFSPDVVLLNWRPGVAERLGLGAEALQSRRPGLIVARFSAYGEVGPWGARPGWEQTAQAATGAQVVWGNLASPDLFPLPFNDLGTGLFGAAAVLAARLCGAGESRAALSATATWALADLLDGAPGRDASALGTGALRRFYRAKDGWVFLSAPEHALGEVERRVGAPVSGWEEAFRAEPVAAWSRRSDAGPGAVVRFVARRTPREVLRGAGDRVHREDVEGVGPVTLTRTGMRLSRTPLVAVSAPPPRGAHGTLGVSAPPGPPAKPLWRWAREQARGVGILLLKPR